MDDLRHRIKHTGIFTIALLLVGGAFLLAGVIRQENRIVLEKAINLCLECIGIG